MALKALIVQGGFKGHEPKETADILAEDLRKRGLEVEISDTLDTFKDREKLAQLDVIIPHWTMGSPENEAMKTLCAAVEGGLSLAGIHGGAGDAFRSAANYQFVVGGQFVAHPGGGKVTYNVHISDPAHPITQGLKDFSVTSEQYYLHIDPAIHVLATTQFGQTVMPVAWIKTYGKGNVYYCSLGHNAEHLSQPEALDLCSRGIVWAAQQTATARNA